MRIDTTFSTVLDDLNNLDFESDLTMTSSSSPITPDTVPLNSPRFVGSNDARELIVLAL